MALLFLPSRMVVRAEDFLPDRVKSKQIVSTTMPPQSPQVFNPDPLTLPVFEMPEQEPVEPGLELRVRFSNGEPPRAPESFNPDPGAIVGATSPPPYFRLPYKPLQVFGTESLAFPLPRFGVREVEIVTAEPPETSNPRHDLLPENLQLPREGVRINESINLKWEAPAYMHKRELAATPTNTVPVVDRWHVKFASWQRYADRPAETPYRYVEPALWSPYRQSLLKGDLPIIGQDIFLNLTAASETVLDVFRLPAASSAGGSQPNRAGVFGSGQQYTFSQTVSLSLNLFEGETVFQPVHWAIKVEPAYNVTDTKIDDRANNFATLQQWFGELHLGDLSDTYDFWAVRAGSQPFNSDFRGFVFNEDNLGVRVFGNSDCNRFQYNVAAFPLLEKDTNSGLNTFDTRDQYVILANLYRQDFIWPGYTAQVSFHANLDNGGTYYDDNGNLVRPEPLGTVKEHDVHAYYLGWAGDGHIGRWNVDHAFYQVLGRDDFNGLAGRPVDINAQMGALEVSYDRDWIRYKASFFYASGDSNAEDGTGTGFDSIVDNPTFIGGPFSFYSHQGINLPGTSVALKQRDSLVMNLRSSKVDGQANFVNPGALIFGLGTDMDLLPKLRSFVNVNYIWFAETDAIKTALFTDKVRDELGLDCSLGFQYRPLHTENIVINAGIGFLVPGSGYRDIYKRPSGHVDDFLYSALCTATLTY